MTHISCQVGGLISQQKERKNNHFSETPESKHFDDLCKTFFFKSMDYIEHLSVSQFYSVSFNILFEYKSNSLH